MTVVISENNKKLSSENMQKYFLKNKLFKYKHVHSYLMIKYNEMHHYLVISIVLKTILTQHGKYKSVKKTNTAPKKKPMATGINANSPLAPHSPESLAMSIAGSKSDQYEAAIIT